jgi:hypothetical protein
MQQHGLDIAMGIRDGMASGESHCDGRASPEPALPPAPASPPPSTAPAARFVVDDDEDDDLPWRRRRKRPLEDEEPAGGERPLQDPDQVERQKRVEVYRRLWEQDSSRSLFVRADSPKPRPWKPANTWAAGRS